jgi:formate-dependent nitrite reductase membrane component NrfD
MLAAIRGAGTVFSLFIIWYLFIAGAGAGAYAIAATVGIVERASFLTSHQAIHEYAQLSRAGFVLAPVLVLFATVFLMADLGAPERAHFIFFNSQPTILTIGAWIVAAFILSSVLLLFIYRVPSFHVSQPLLLIVEFIAAALALGVMVYAGIFVSGIPAIPFLNTPLLTVLFVLSSLSNGVAVITLYGFFNQQHKAICFGLRQVPRIDLFLIVLEVAVLAALLFTMLASDWQTARESVTQLYAGDWAPLFWFGVLVAGLMLPALLGIFDLRYHQPALPAFSAVLLLVGGFSLRYCLLAVGTHVQFLELL